VEYYKNEKIFFKLGINSSCNYVSFKKNLKSEWRELTLSGKSVIEEYRDSLFGIIGSDWEY
ncbi:MAG: hypothetical protein JW915_00980, partial [Chitinispirillaceae bacterium]|nr:hypothetical protein [Chitinispirillaceae bacterium]